MALTPLADNVLEITITPFLGLELLPDNSPDWGLVVNNNLIKLECGVQKNSEELAVTRNTLDNTVLEQNESIVAIQSAVENEAILRAQGDANLQAQIPSNPARVERFTGQALGTTATSLFHGLGGFPRVTIVRESDGIDVTGHFDTVIKNLTVNDVQLTVGAAGTYTIVIVG